MHILVTGCNGFIGRNLIEWLLAEDWQVDGWDIHDVKLPNVSKYQWVIHVGAKTTYTDTEDILSKNYDFSKWLFNECQLHEVNFQYASCYNVYGQLKDYSEYSVCVPQSTIAWSKYLVDRWVFSQPITKSFVQGFRYFDVYGKYQNNNISKWKDEARNTGIITASNHAEYIKHDWVWVGDVCKIHIEFIKNVNGSGLWNIGSGLCHSDLDIIEEIASLENATVVTINDDKKPIKTCANLSLLKSTIGKHKWLNIFEWL